ncbi:PIG-L deacetylase family protein, partial [Escherichia coli]|uniref:PIG-L deacetylase family protein n=1 Tax=Escherichia coli TaxID=562 RepID=UPI00156C0416
MDKVLDSALLSSANKRKGILAIGAHPDDIELGCGASLARLAQKGIYIAAVVMTTGGNDSNLLIVFYVQIMPDD